MLSQRYSHEEKGKGTFNSARDWQSGVDEGFHRGFEFSSINSTSRGRMEVGWVWGLFLPMGRVQAKGRRSVKLIFTGDNISLMVAFQGPNVILGLYKCNYS